MSWAALVKAPAAASGPEAPAGTPLHQSRVAVVDANAIISGLSLAGIAERYVTIQEVLDEVRDKQARQALATLPFTLEVTEPEAASLTAVTTFARETGDLHALSQADLKLLALAHMLEVAAHGSAHLRQHPVQVVARTKHRNKGRGLPGWGTVPNPQDWAAIDALPDSAGAQGSSRIRAAVQDLDSSAAPAAHGDAAASSAAAPTSLPRPGPAADASSAPSGDPAAAASAPGTAKQQQQQPFASFGDAAAADLAAKVGSAADQLQASQWFKAGQQKQPQQPQQPGDMFAGVSHFTGSAAAVAATVLPAPPQQGSGADGSAAFDGEHDEDDEDDDEDEDEDGWETAKGSRAAARRAKRRQLRWEARQQIRQQQAEAAAAAGAGAGAEQGAGQKPLQEQQQPAAAVVAPAGAAAASGQQEASAAGQQAPAPVGEQDGADEEEEGEEEDGSEEEEEEDEGEEGEDEEDEFEEGEEEEGEEEDASTVAATEADSTATGGAGASVTTQHSEAALNTTSNVLSVTADFAMQNVLLQMGLRLLTPNGKQITRLSRWVVRCSACFFVTKEVGRMFCPKCGNMTLERVEVTVGPGGAELYGVRKRHTLRGTVFSLPKPKGGRAPNPILREDELIRKTRPRRKKAPPKPQDVDPFAPEFTQETWHTVSGAPTQAALASTKGAAYTLASWKHNPNERKGAATNRRRK